MRIGVGVWSMQSVAHRPTSQALLYRRLVEDARLAERVGLDSLWLSEHHFWYDGHCPAMLPAAGAVLGATDRLGVGTAVLLLPMHDPAGVADDALRLAALSGGRFQLGVGLGYREAEFDGFGIRRRDRGRLMDHHLGVLLDRWRQASERPAPVLVGIASEPAAARAGRFGLPVFADSTMGPDELALVMASYREAAGAAGAAVPASQGLQRDVWVTEDPERDWRMLLPELRVMRRQYGGWSLPPEPGEPRPAYLERLEGDVQAKLGNLIFGDVAHVVAELRRFEALGFDLAVCRTQFMNVPRQDLHRSMQGLGRVQQAMATP